MRRLSCLGLLFLATAVPLGAQEERAIDNFAGLGVRAMGMGGAYVGVADDFTAIYWNPAGLAQIRQREVYVAVLDNRFKSHSTLAGVRASEALSNTRFGSLGVVVPYPVYRGSLVFAAGFNRVKDFDWTLRTQGFSQASQLQEDFSFRHEGELAVTSLAAAVEVSPLVSLGVTLNRVSGEDDATNQSIWEDTQNHFVEKRFVARDTFEDDYQPAWGGTLGAMFRSPRQEPRVRLGAALSTGVTHQIRYTFRGVPSDTLYNLVEYDDGTLKENPGEKIEGTYKLSLPLEFCVGGSIRPVRGLWLAASAHFAEWSQAEYEGQDENQLRTNAAFDKQYKNRVRYHLGVEWQVPVIALDLRAGYYFDPLPFVGPRDPNREVDPQTNPRIVAEQDRRFWTLGAGMLFDQVVRAEMAWAHGTYEQKEGELTEKNTADRVFFGVSYRF